MTKKVLDSPRGGTSTIDDLYTMVVPEIPCEYVTGVFPDTKPCQNEAAWVIHTRGHCIKDAITQRLLCDDCLERIQNGDVWRCIRCSAYARIRDYITKIERI